MANDNTQLASPAPAPTASVDVLPPPRSVFKSKTALAQYVLASAGALAAFVPNAVPYVSDHAGAIMMIAAVANIAIRHFTHGKVVLFNA